MEERKASGVAAVVGVVAVGAFWLARPTHPAVTLRVTEQWTPSAASDDGDAVALFRFEMHGARHEVNVEGKPLEFRVVGSNGRTYPLVPAEDPLAQGALKLQKGYAHRLASPRLVAFLDGVSVASARLGDVPDPVERPLKPTPNPPIALYYRIGTGLYADPHRPIPSNERWRIVARRTPFASDLATSADLSTMMERPGNRRLNVPFASEAGLVEIDVVRFRLVPHSEIVEVPNLRLVPRFGGTALVVDRTTTIPSRLGAEIRVPAQDNGPRHRLRRSDPRSVSANVLVAPPWSLDSSTMPPHRERGPRFELLAPNPERLGLNELRIGGSTLVSRSKATKPIEEAAFTAKVRLIYYRSVPIGTERMVVPVEAAPPGSFMPRI